MRSWSCFRLFDLCKQWHIVETAAWIMLLITIFSINLMFFLRHRSVVLTKLIAHRLNTFALNNRYKKVKCTVIIHFFFTSLNNVDNVRYEIMISDKRLWDQNIFAGISFLSSPRKSVQNVRFGYLVGCNVTLKILIRLIIVQDCHILA